MSNRIKKTPARKVTPGPGANGEPKGERKPATKEEALAFELCAERQKNANMIKRVAVLEAEILSLRNQAMLVEYGIPETAHLTTDPDGSKWWEPEAEPVE